MLTNMDAVAVRATVEIVARATAADLDRPTPCAGWLLRDLLAHMTAQHHGFADAARGGTDPGVWEPLPLAGDFVGAYARAADDVLDAFADDGLLDRVITMPEAPGPVPGRLAVGFHLVDYVVHGWDAARALDLDWRLPPEVPAAALPIAEAVPDGEFRLRPDAPFAPRRPEPAGGAALDRILALLGRSPDWQPHGLFQK